MPQTKLIFYQQRSGEVPALDWLDDLQRKHRRAHAKLAAKLIELSELGFKAKRPLVGYLGDDIYELRARVGRVNYRILFFFYRKEDEEAVVVLTHGFTKEREAPRADIDRALR